MADYAGNARLVRVTVPPSRAQFETTMLRSLLFPSLSALLALGAPGCAKTDHVPAAAAPATPPAVTAPAKVAEKPKDVAITGVHVGSGRGQYDHVAVEKHVFSPKDTIAVSVYSDGSAKTANIGVRWLDARGDVLGSEMRLVTYNGSLATLFEFADPKGLPVGTYSIEVRLDDWLAETAHFEVK